MEHKKNKLAWWNDSTYPTGNILQLLLMIVFMAGGELLADNPFLGAFVYLSVDVVVVGLHSAPASNRFRSVPSYYMFSRMRLFATVAVELGAMMMFCHVVVANAGLLWWHRYVVLTVWVLLLEAMGWVFARYVRGRWKGLALAEFVIGAVVWVLGEVFLLRANSLIPSLLWGAVWVYGIVLVYSSLLNFSHDFSAVGRLAEQPLTDDDLVASNHALSRQASLVSAGVMLLAMALWMWGKPLIVDTRIPRVLQLCMVQVPVLFMLLALYYAAKNPLDRRNREKLVQYINSRTDNELVHRNLQRLLDKKAPFGSRLICWLAMPFFRHKIVGLEYLQRDKFPSVFVCNHGFLYGPIVAALYLPTYFRPWIHDRMLNVDMAAREIELSFAWVKKIFGRKMARTLYRTFARWVVKLLESFRPIPVVRGASKEGAITFDLSLQALQEGDNLLIFPEKPKRLAVEPEAALRNLYTGFAHIGKLYHEATGRNLMFYPIYSDHRSRSFYIGEPVQYDPTLSPRDAKRAVAEQLQQRMEKMLKI